jgi:hypothetical protein
MAGTASGIRTPFLMLNYPRLGTIPEVIKAALGREVPMI